MKYERIMARIRTIKPEFSTDGKIRRLSDSTALFFILLWNHCDDYGYFEIDTWELAMKTARWRSQDIMRMLKSLHGAGLVRLSTGDGRVMDMLSTGHGLGMVTSWRHQRIDKPKPSKWESVDIQWDDAEPFAEDSKNVRRKDRIGKDRIGKERIPVGSKFGAEPSQGTLDDDLFGEPASRDSASPVLTGTVQSRCIAEYHELWSAMYGGRAPCMPKERRAIGQVVKELGEARTLQLLAAFFKIPDQWVRVKHHDLITFENNIAKIAAFADSGTLNVINHAESRSIGNQAALEKYHRSIEGKEI